MKENKVLCDHCGKKLNNMEDYIDVEIELGHIWRSHDLCSECIEGLKDVIDEYCAKYQTEKGGAQE